MKKIIVLNIITNNWKVRKDMLSQGQAQIPVWSISLWKVKPIVN